MNFNRISLFATAVGVISLVGSDGTKTALAAPDQTLGMALMSAVVNAAGTLVRGSGAVSSTRILTGRYRVLFDRPVTDCTFTASGGGAIPGLTYLTIANVSRTVDAENSVSVATSLNTDGTALNSDFHLLVFCAK